MIDNVKKILLLPILMAAFIPGPAQHTPVVDCKVLNKLPDYRRQGFEKVKAVTKVDDRISISDLELFEGEEALHVYVTPGGAKHLLSSRMMFADRDSAIAAYDSLYGQLAECLGDEWTHTNERYSGSARIRIFRGEFHPADKDPDKGMMLLHVRETLSTKEYYISFSYE